MKKIFSPTVLSILFVGFVFAAVLASAAVGIVLVNGREPTMTPTAIPSSTPTPIPTCTVGVRKSLPDGSNQNIYLTLAGPQATELCQTILENWKKSDTPHIKTTIVEDVPGAPAYCHRYFKRTKTDVVVTSDTPDMGLSFCADFMQ